MTDYTKLVEALRCGLMGDDECRFKECPYWSELGCKDGIIASDAAAAIEALQAEVEILKVSGREAYFEGLAADKEPKRGEWIRHPEVKNIYGGEFIECPFCGEKYVVQYIADEKFCRNCGADLRAKMEVQE